MKCRVLLVDDEPSILFAAQRYLTANGFEVQCAQELEEAQALLSNDAFDIVVTGSTRMKPSLAGRWAQASSTGKTTFNLRFEIQEKGDPMSRKKILIVDDSATILMMERMILSKGPYALAPPAHAHPPPSNPGPNRPYPPLPH